MESPHINQGEVQKACHLDQAPPRSQSGVPPACEEVIGNPNLYDSRAVVPPNEQIHSLKPVKLDSEAAQPGDVGIKVVDAHIRWREARVKHLVTGILLAIVGVLAPALFFLVAVIPSEETRKQVLELVRLWFTVIATLAGTAAGYYFKDSRRSGDP